MFRRTAPALLTSADLRDLFASTVAEAFAAVGWADLALVARDLPADLRGVGYAAHVGDLMREVRERGGAEAHGFARLALSRAAAAVDHARDADAFAAGGSASPRAAGSRRAAAEAGRLCRTYAATACRTA